MSYEWLPADVELLSDPAPADWVVERLRPWDRDAVRVASFVPDVYEADARVFHPAGDRGVPSNAIRWGDLAGRRGLTLAAESGFLEIAGIDASDQRALDDLAPLEGSLPESTLAALTAFLSSWTESGTPCWFCLWDGWGTWWKGAHASSRSMDGKTRTCSGSTRSATVCCAGPRSSGRRRPAPTS